MLATTVPYHEGDSQCANKADPDSNMFSQIGHHLDPEGEKNSLLYNFRSLMYDIARDTG
jgi:hypothetical protein